MYSLYRAWLSLSPCAAFPAPLPHLSANPLSLTTPSANQTPETPDVTLQVGPSLTHFSAHKAVLSAHSGFFKAALTNYSGLTPIAVPNVNVDEFSSLLTFMYTGYLDLNITNIYNILLATHMLHMPRAPELCRSFLLQTQSTEQRPSIIKPIPSRKTALPTQQIYPPSFGSLKKSEDTPFKAVNQDKIDNFKPSTSKEADDKPLAVEKKNNGSSSNKKKRSSASSTSSEKVVIDIACCDGPVRFHRVINKNYGLQNTENFEVTQVNRNAAMNKAMNENIREQMSDENQNSSNQSNTEVFTCVYCNHTFKSQYCYQKHSRRHLYPVNIEAKGASKESKREVKLLDMNVQYYPCKTCGSKFPSYYFVHKHRKLCHAEEVADKNNKNNEIVVENRVENDNEGSNCSAIDVEAVNSENS